MPRFISIGLPLPKGHWDPKTRGREEGGGTANRPTWPLSARTGAFALHMTRLTFLSASYTDATCLSCPSLVSIPPDARWGKCSESSRGLNIWKAPTPLSSDSNTINAICLPFTLPFSQSWVPFDVLHSAFQPMMSAFWCPSLCLSASYKCPIDALHSALQPSVSAFRCRTWSQPSWLHMWGGLAAQRPSRTSQSGKCRCCTTAVGPLRRSWSAHDKRLLISLLSVFCYYEYHEYCYYYFCYYYYCYHY